jgi:hypothetical protein
MSGSAYDYVNNTGVIVPDTTDLQTEVRGEYQAVWPTISLEETTPQGVLMTGEITSRTNVIQNIAKVANQINPNESEGIFLDGICTLTGLLRSGNTYSLYSNVQLGGAVDTPIPQYTQAETPNGDIFQTISAVSLDPSTGLATVNMIAVQPGPVAAPNAALTLISAVFGLTSITPSAAGTVGVAQQSDVSLRALRRNTLALQSVSSVEAIVSALNALPNVLAVRFLENIGAAQTIDTIAMAANSIWACVDGGVPLQIATAILTNKSDGANWNGAQSVAVTDPNSGQVYNVLYDIPTLVPMQVRITVVQGTYSGSLISAVTNAMLAYASNTVAENTSIDLGIVGFKLGNNVSPFGIASGIAAQVLGCIVQLVEISTVAANSYQTTEVAMNINQTPTIIVAKIDVVVGTGNS